MKYHLGKHPNNLMPYKVIPRYGLGASNQYPKLSTIYLVTTQLCAILSVARSKAHHVGENVSSPFLYETRNIVGALPSP